MPIFFWRPAHNCMLLATAIIMVVLPLDLTASPSIDGIQACQQWLCVTARMNLLQLRGGGGKGRTTLEDEIRADVAKLAEHRTGAEESIPSDANFSEGSYVSEWHDSDLNIETQMLAQCEIARQHDATRDIGADSDSSVGISKKAARTDETESRKRPGKRERNTSSAAELSSSSSSSEHVPVRKKTLRPTLKHAVKDTRARPADQSNKTDTVSPFDKTRVKGVDVTVTDAARHIKGGKKGKVVARVEQQPIENGPRYLSLPMGRRQHLVSLPLFLSLFRACIVSHYFVRSLARACSLLCVCSLVLLISRALYLSFFLSLSCLVSFPLSLSLRISRPPVRARVHLSLLRVRALALSMHPPTN